MRALVAASLAALAAAAASSAATPPLTVLPRPPFPAPAGAAHATGATRLVLVASHPHAPGLGQERATPAWLPQSYRGLGLQRAIGQGNRLFALYGRDGATARILVAANARSHAVAYALDFGAYLRPPRTAPGAADLVDEEIEWAREAGGVLYVESTHLTYAVSSARRNAYVTAIDLRTRRVRWRSPALVANARTFALAGDALVTGYGFTAEPDFLYLLDRATGRVRGRLALPSAPERIVRRGSTLFVRTYDHDLVVALRGR